MREIFFFVIIQFIYCSQINGINYFYSIQITPTEKLTLDSTKQFQILKCESVQPVTWFFFYKDELDFMKYSITENINDTGSYITHVANLELRLLDYRYVRYYYCIHKDVNDLNGKTLSELRLLEEYGKLAKKYIYFNDPDHPIAYNPKSEVILQEDGNFKAYIPCKPTSEKVINLYIENDGKKYYMQNAMFPFDLNYGFLIEISKDEETENEVESIVYTCYGNDDMGGEFIVISPSINQKITTSVGRTHIELNEQFTTNCSFELKQRYSFEPNILWTVQHGNEPEEDIEWWRPETDKTITNGIVKHSSLVRLEGENKSKISSFKCTVSFNNKYEQSKKLIIFFTDSSNTPFLEIKPITNRVQIIDSIDSQIEAEFYKSKQIQPIIQWFRPNGTEIEKNEKFEIYQNDSYVRLTIKTFNSNDNGEYRLSLKTEAIKVEETFLQIILYKPTLMGNDSVEANKGEIKNFICKSFGAGGFHLITSLKFVPCQLYGEILCGTAIHFIGKDIELSMKQIMEFKPKLHIMQEEKFSYKFEFSIEAIRSGYVEWEIENNNNSTRLSTNLTTLISNSLSIVDYRHTQIIKIQENEILNLTCVGSEKTYDSLSWYLHNKPTDDYDLKNKPSNLLFRVLIINEIDDYGILKYECRGKIRNEKYYHRIYVILEIERGFLFHRPRIEHLNNSVVSTDQSITLTEDGLLSLRCQCYVPIRWIKFDNRNIAVELNNYSSTEKKNDMFSIKLDYPNVSADKVGFYFCVHKDISKRIINEKTLKIFEMQDRIAKIYLFVNLIRSNQVFLKNQLSSISFEKDNNDYIALVPCKPVEDVFEIYFHFNHRSYSSREILNFGYYDAKYGLYLEYSKLLSEMTQEQKLLTIECKENTRKDYVNFRFFTPVFNITTISNHPLEEETLQINCSFSYLKKIHDESDFRPNIDTPNNNEKRLYIAVEDIEHKDETNVTIMTKVITFSILKVKQTKDSGYYYFIIHFPNFNYFKSVPIYVRIRDKSQEPYINLTRINNEISLANANGSLILVSRIQSKPKPKFNWSLPNGSFVEMSSTKYHINNLLDSMELIIYNLSSSDNGNYSLLGRNEAGRHRIDYDVRVKDKAISTTRDVYTKFGNNITCELNLTVWKEAEIVSLKYVQCELENGTLKECHQDRSINFFIKKEAELFNIKKFTPKLEFSNLNYYEYLNKFSFHPQEMGLGVLTWTIKNNFGLTENSSRVHIGDISKPLEVNNEEEIVRAKEGDEIVFDCSALKTIYQENINWYKENMENGESEIMISSSDIFLNRRDSNFSYKLIMEFAKIKRDYAGIYECRAYYINSTKYDSKRTVLEVSIQVIPVWIFILIGGLLFILTAVGVYLTLRFKREYIFRSIMRKMELEKFNRGAIEQINPDLPLDQQAELLPYDNRYEFPDDRLIIGKILGSGAFGVVNQAVAKNIIVNQDETVVAVKTIKTKTDEEIIKAMKCELKIMVHLGKHLNVVNLLGAITKNIRWHELKIIVEYCQYGCLYDYLKKNRINFVNQIDKKSNKICTKSLLEELKRSKKQKKYENPYITDPPTENYVTTSHLICWSFQLACGMGYLSSKQVIHGDLAARNILLCDNNVIKISDFGLSKSIYKKKYYVKQSKDTKLPVRWMAPESLMRYIFNSSTDVWSFGITLWEIFSLSAMPYPGIEFRYVEFCEILNSGYRMDCPKYANKEIYKIICDCWNHNPKKRPTFAEVELQIGNLLGPQINEYFIDLNSFYVKENFNNLKTDYFSLIKFSNENPSETQPNIKILWDNYESADC